MQIAIANEYNNNELHITIIKQAVWERE